MKVWHRLLLFACLLGIAVATLRMAEGRCAPDWLCERPAGLTEPSIIEWSVR